MPANALLVEQLLARSSMDPIKFLVPVIRPLMRRSIAAKVAQLDQLAPQPGRVVFLGDSITEGGAWDELFPDLPCLRRGIGGDSVGGVRSRLDSALHEPLAVSLLIGTNDLHGLGKTRDVDEIAEQFRDLVGAITAAAPDALLVVNSLTPRTKSWTKKIHALNRHYADIAADAGATYVDLWPALADDEGALRKEFTRDRLHLTVPGYQAWVEVLRPHLAPFAERPDHQT
jgi:lysophospholipase L1-like esterase